MIREIQIDQFKSLVGFSVPLAKFTCLVGLNGAGKTNLLQAIDFLAQVMGGHIQKWLEQREWSANSLLYSLGRKKRLVHFHVLLELENEIICWEGKFNIYQLRCTSEKVYFKNKHENLLVVLDGKYWLDQGAGNQVSFEYQGSILSQLKEASLGQHQQIIISLKKFFQDIKSLELLAPHLMRQRARISEDIGMGGERLSGFLSQLTPDGKKVLLNRLRNFSPDLLNVSTRALRGGWQQLLFWEKFKEYINNSHETSVITEARHIEARHINDGLLRQLAILAQTMTRHRFLLFDEIENGMNQELVGKLVQHLLDAPQQIVVTTHSPQIINFLPDDVAREGVILLYRTPQGITRARRYFDLPVPAEKLASLGPGEVYADTPLDEVVRSALEKDTNLTTALERATHREGHVEPIIWPKEI